MKTIATSDGLANSNGVNVDAYTGFEVVNDGTNTMIWADTYEDGPDSVTVATVQVIPALASTDEVCFGLCGVDDYPAIHTIVVLGKDGTATQAWDYNGETGPEPSPPSICA